MSSHNSAQYLDSKVFTASQPQLHLMLLDGAVRFVRLAQQQWNDESGSALSEQSLDRSITILEELVLGVSTATSEISQQLEEQYAFLYRELTDSRVNHDLEKLGVCLNLLVYEQETWQRANALVEADDPASQSVEKVTPAPAIPHSQIDTFTSGGLSIEA